MSCNFHRFVILGSDLATSITALKGEISAGQFANLIQFCVNLGATYFVVVTEMPALSPLNTDTSSSPSNNQSQAFTAPSTVMRVDPECFPQSPASSQVEVFTTESAHLHKFKQNILHRYLHDSVQHQHFQYGALRSGTKTPSTVRVFNNRDSIGSTGDFEDVSSTSPNSTGSDGNQSIFQDGRSPYGTHAVNTIYFQLGKCKQHVERMINLPLSKV